MFWRRPREETHEEYEYEEVSHSPTPPVVPPSESRSVHRTVRHSEVTDEPMYPPPAASPPHESRVSSDDVVERAPWSPAQLVALVIGAFLLIHGGIALTRGGFDDVTNHTIVMGVHTTPLLGIIHLVFGGLMLMAGAVPGAGRGTMAFLGAIALVWGVVVTSAAPSFHSTLAMHYGTGWMYVVIGLASLLAAFAAPVLFGRTRIARRY